MFWLKSVDWMDVVRCQLTGWTFYVTIQLIGWMLEMCFVIIQVIGRMFKLHFVGFKVIGRIFELFCEKSVDWMNVLGAFCENLS